MSINRFNLRVYGLLIQNDRVLVTYENRGGILMTKFPGGGLEKGEGIKDCLIREFREEMDIAIVPTDFYYVNDFLQLSAFNENDQLISFYYTVESNDIDKILISEFDPNLKKDDQLFAWVDLANIESIDFTFPIDQKVGELLAQSF